MITVAQLIEQLRALPQDALVISEGCDCDGLAGCAEDAGNYEIYDRENYTDVPPSRMVRITRHETDRGLGKFLGPVDEIPLEASKETEHAE